MIHTLARRHYKLLANTGYKVTQYEENESFNYLNLNINSFSSDPYKFYPVLGQKKLALKYIQTLGLIQEQQTLHLDPGHFLFTQGAAEAIDLIIRAFCEPEKEAILITSPTFPYYAYRAKFENVRIIDVPLLGVNFDHLDIDKILHVEAKVLFLCTPNNPVGTTLDRKEMEIIIKQFPGIVVVDEAYIEWTEEKSVAEWVTQYENLIVLRTFSKIWGLAGVRVGVAIANKSIIHTMSLMQSLFSFPDSSRDLALAKLNEVDKLLENKKEVEPLRKALYDFLSSSSLVEKVYPGKANFLLATFKDAKFILEVLFKNGILVADVTQQLPGGLRISVGSQEEIDKLLRVLGNW